MPIDITDQPRRVQYAINGTGPYDFDFEVLATTDVAVYRDTTLLASGYTATLNADGTGSVELDSATGDTLTIAGARPYRRITDFATGGDLTAATLNSELDSLQIQILQLREKALRALTVSETDEYPDPLPTASERAGKFAAYDASGHPIASDGDVTGVPVETVTQIVSTLAALKALAAPSTAVTYFTLGYYAAGDGGNGIYRWSSASTATADDGAVVALDSAPTTGRFLLMHDGEVTTLQYGVYHDGTNGATNRTRGQAAIDYCQDNLVALKIPRNLPSVAIKIAASAGVGWKITKPMALRGPGSFYCTIEGTGFAANQYPLDIDGTVYGTFDGARIGGFSVKSSSTSAYAVRIKNVSKSRFFDIGLELCHFGIVYTGTRCFSNVFEEIYHVQNVFNVMFNITAHTGGGHHSFCDCTFGGDTGFSVSSDSQMDSINFYNCNWEQCTTNSASFSGNIAGIGFYGGRTEGCQGRDFSFNPTTGKVISGLVVDGVAFGASDAGGSDRIIIGGAGGKVRGWKVTCCTVSHGDHIFAANLVNLNGEGESGEISNNYMDGLRSACAPVNALRTGVRTFNNEANDGKFPDRMASVVAATQTISAVGNAISAVGDVVQITNSSGGSLTLTSAPTIADGTEGQPIEIINVGTQDVVIQDQGTLASSNLRLTGTSITLGPRDSVQLRYSATVGDWVQVGPLVNVL